ncbi:LuxR C-terminal-related transcriptional regulator [Trujillonella endophytica]|uniref:LuxR family transcriptional regulator, maltose regulon positive regulatory protein n=1 Tax=Trujillonella endophytica TaxID=673521 RepID=A0A1H8QN39_9ACTN|nr:LuxR C-terminal-related transcriptional regulator [Trujillella endophytica]SEO55655.1 LuxR family transcriptional regulator, maltose regulon positive regulatory protein [Trujillella endophytica]
MSGAPTSSLRIPASKIAVPELPAEFRPRRALRRLLEQAAPDQVIVVSAPAGFGKTLLLADWVRESDWLETAWVSLDDDDDDPRRLWSAALGGLLELPSCAGDPELQRLAASLTVSRGADVVEDLADALDTLTSPVRLVLDDVHALTGREVLHDLAALVRRRPSRLALVVAGRIDPPISVPRLRLEGRLHEVRAEALRFTPQDAAVLLDASGLDLTARQVAVLHERTEGWAAGLRLAALALLRTDDVDAFLASFSGDERSVAEYLTGEILDGLDPDDEQFLRVVSVCTPVPAALAAALSGDAAAEATLDGLRASTALVERTPRADHRLHPLLRSYLVADLARQEPERYRQLNATAARWWSGQGEPVHALRHAERADDDALTTELLRRSGVALLLAGDLGPLRRALAAVGPGARARDPWLALIAALAHLDERALVPAAAELDDARRAWPDAPDTALETLRDCAELLAGALGLPRVPVPPPRLSPGDDGPELAALRHVSLGIAEFANPAGPDVPLARTHLERARDLAEEHDLAYLEVQSLATLSALATIDGDLRAMAAAAESAVAAAARTGRHPSAWSAGPTGMLAYADLLFGDPGQAALRSGAALDSWEALPPESAYVLHAVHGAAVADLGRPAEGFAEIRAARAVLGDAPVTPPVLAGLAVLEHRVALLNGNVGAADEVALWLADRVGATGETLLLGAWTEAAAGRYEAAAAAVAPVHRPDVLSLLPETVVEALLAEAEAALQHGDRPAGWSALEAALGRAEPLGVVRPFALAGPRTQELLRARTATARRGSFAGQVAAARAGVSPEPPALLSEREQAVLALLPSLLNAREIADEFTVSVNTIKSHIRSIYAKLGVSSRREAVLLAADRGLLR